MAGRPRNAVILTDEERATLLRWTRSRTCSQARALRAQIVLTCSQEPTNTAVAEQLGISRDMVSKWRARFLTERLDGLDEQLRSGRPPVADDDTVAHLLVRTLTPPPGGRKAWSTRTMAVETGLSQSTVNRIWRTYHIHRGANGTATPRRAWSLPNHAEHVVGLFLAPPVCVLAVTTRDAAGASAVVGQGQDEPHVFAVACAFAALRGKAQTVGTSWTDSPALQTFLERVRRAAGDEANVHLLASGVPAQTWTALDGSDPAASSRFRWHRAHSPEAWIGETHRILAARSRPPHAPGADLPHLRESLLTWCSTWTAATSPFTRAAAPRPLYEAPDVSGANVSDAEICGSGNDSLAVDLRADHRPETPDAPILPDPTAGLLRDALLTSGYHPGDRVREAPLAARLGISRRGVRAALRTLAEEGMLDPLPNGGFAIPGITAKDVLDLYSLRATLGAMLIRRVAMFGPERLAPVTAALADVRTASRDSDHARIREDDLRFQDAFARTADLPQAARTFEHLTARLRTFVNVLDMDYGQAGVLIADEDTAVHDALLKADGNEAARLWRIKMERCVRYMIAQLPEGHDPHLWTTLTGRPHPRPGDPRTTGE